MKKTIIDLGKLLMLSNKMSKINKNFEVNKQSSIEEFNNMMLGIVKDIKRESTNTQQKEVINQKSQPKKQVVSVIKKYIEGKIQAYKINQEVPKKRKERKIVIVKIKKVKNFRKKNLLKENLI